MSNFKNAASFEPNVEPQKSYQLLSFHLTAQLQALLPTEQLGEVLSLEAPQIVPVFDLPEAVMGIYNFRGEVLWIVDLAGLLGLETLFEQDCRQFYSVMVVQRLPLQVGVAVRQVGQLIFCPAARIQPSPPAIASELSSKLAFCLKGLYHSPEQRNIPVLDGDKILNLLKTG